MRAGDQIRAIVQDQAHTALLPERPDARVPPSIAAGIIGVWVTMPIYV